MFITGARFSPNAAAGLILSGDHRQSYRVSSSGRPSREQLQEMDSTLRGLAGKKIDARYPRP